MRLTGPLLCLLSLSMISVSAAAPPPDPPSWLRLSAQPLPRWWSKLFEAGRPKLEQVRRRRRAGRKLDEPLRSLFCLAEGLAALRDGEAALASAAFAQIEALPLKSLTDFLSAEAALQRGAYRDAGAQLEALLERDPGSLWSHRARFRFADALAGQGNYAAAAERLRAALRLYPEYPYREAALLALIRWELRAGRLSAEEEAGLQEHALLDEGSLQDLSLSQARLFARLLRPDAAPFTQQLSIIETLRKWKYHESALKLTGTLLQAEDLSAKQRAELQLERGRILLRMERPLDALKVLQQLIAESKDRRWRRRGWWWSSTALSRLGRIEAAAEALRRGRISSGSAATQARLGQLYFEGGLYRRARTAWERALREPEDDKPFYLAKRMMPWLDFRLGETQRFSRRFRSRRSPYIHYWWARAQEKSGAATVAHESYQALIDKHPISFYSYAAAQRLTAAGITPRVPWRTSPGAAPPHRPAPPLFETLRDSATRWGEQQPLFEATYGLTLIGERRWAVIYLRMALDELRAWYRSSWGRRRSWAYAATFYLDNREGSRYGIWGLQERLASPRPPWWSARFRELRPTALQLELQPTFEALGDHYFARRRYYYDGEKLSHPEASGELSEWQRRYPRSFPAIVRESSAKYGVDPSLIWALMTVESSHNPWAISRVGARGLMQVMPHTGRLSADRMGWPYFGAPLLFEPEVAIEMAAWYFRQLLDKFQGQLPLAMAAYNAGPHRVEQWIQHKGHLPLDEFIEEIPYAQAREYAKKVTRHLGLYRRLYEGAPGAIFQLKVNRRVYENINY
ncbi:MAG: transglycosylase SLT domain-containing protein [Myxococcota bacterium]|nr:transglycosylase SLT domain-containing protein [Myxococcota bacterium]